ncbi:MAG: restriction endonuclease subunit S [Gemmatimonadales bacterium]|nr:restriction endonuclease subunit S [Gemmatimonadales bacterium]
MPEHWGVVPLKQLARVVNGYPFDSELFDANEGVPLVRIRDLNEAETATRYKGPFVEAAAISANDVLVGMDGDFNIGRWRGDGVALLNQRMCCVRGSTPAITRLLEYVLPVPLKVINDTTYATTVKHLASHQVEKTLVALPANSREVDGILSFLDRETTKIDALVAEQQRLMELLKEKRQAVISHAVTKGLNPDAPMKPSGVEWLGEVPAHWEVVQLKHVVQMQSGVSITAEAIEEDGLYPVFGGGGLRGYSSEYTHDGDFVLVGRQGALCGNINYGAGRFWASEHAVVATPLHPVAIKWLGEMMRSMNLNQYSVSAAQPGLSVDLIGRIMVPLPPLEEQSTIGSLIAKAVGDADPLLAEIVRALQLLQERRSALISAAVTGQIDVRHLATAEAA